jgi:hypothetical protein
MRCSRRRRGNHTHHLFLALPWCICAVTRASLGGFTANREPLGAAAIRNMRVKGLAGFTCLASGIRGCPIRPTWYLRLVLNTYLGTGYPMLASASHAEGCYPCQFDALNVR